jgi:6-phosphogluconolactonase (cycloisomerase 2 family)
MKGEPVLMRKIAIVGTVSLVLAGCGGGSSGSGTNHNNDNTGNDGNTPTILTITTISPTSAVAGGGAFTLTVNGGNFVSGSVVNFGGTAVPTTFVYATQLTSAIPAAAIASAGTAAVTVTNPPPGGGTSNTVTFTISGSSGSCPQSITVDPTGKFVYVANSSCDAFVGNVSMYTLNPATGALTSIGPPVTAADFGSRSVAVDPTGKFAYVANLGDADQPGATFNGSVSIYTIHPDSGALTSIGTIEAPCAPPPSPGSCSPISVAVHPSGKFAYVANEGGFAPTSVSMYTIDATTGTLAFIGMIATAGRANSVAVDPSGRFAYVANSGSNDISMFSINSITGVLTSTGTVAAGLGPRSVAVDPSGKFAYVTNSDEISMYTINANTGTLTPIGTIPEASGAVAVHPSGKFAYVLTVTNNVSMYSIDVTTGALTSIGTTTAGSSPTSVAIDPSGKFAYVANANSNNISMYTIDTVTGLLTLIGTIGT